MLEKIKMLICLYYFAQKTPQYLQPRLLEKNIYTQNRTGSKELFCATLVPSNEDTSPGTIKTRKLF